MNAASQAKLEIARWNKDIGEQIRTIRKFSGLTQRQAALLSGISEHSYIRIELGKRGLYLHEALRIARVLNVQVEKLLPASYR